MVVTNNRRLGTYRTYYNPGRCAVLKATFPAQLKCRERVALAYTVNPLCIVVEVHEQLVLLARSFYVNMPFGHHVTSRPCFDRAIPSTLVAGPELHVDVRCIGMVAATTVKAVQCVLSVRRMHAGKAALDIHMFSSPAYLPCHDPRLPAAGL